LQGHSIQEDVLPWLCKFPDPISNLFPNSCSEVNTKKDVVPKACTI
jgi:hypothetical protein